MNKLIDKRFRQFHSSNFVEHFDASNASIGQVSNPRDVILASAAMVVEDAKAVAGKVLAGDITPVERVALDAQTDAVEHQIERKGICSLFDWQAYEQHSGPHETLP